MVMTPDPEIQKWRSLPIIRKEKQASILLIESELNTRRQISCLLDSQGYEVIPAATVVEACGLMQSRQFAFILFNWFLEGNTEMAFCKTLRTIDGHTPAFF